MLRLVINALSAIKKWQKGFAEEGSSDCLPERGEQVEKQSSDQKQQVGNECDFRSELYFRRTSV